MCRYVSVGGSTAMARDESLTEGSWFWLLETLKPAGAVAFEISPLANLSYNSFGDKYPGRKFSNHTNWKKNLGRQTVCKENYVNLTFFSSFLFFTLAFTRGMVQCRTQSRGIAMKAGKRQDCFDTTDLDFYFRYKLFVRKTLIWLVLLTDVAFPQESSEATSLPSSPQYSEK